MRKLLSTVFVLLCLTAVSQDKLSSRSIAIEPKAGYAYDVLYNNHMVSFDTHFSISFNSTHSLIFGADLIYTKARDIEYSESHWGPTMMRNIHAVYVNLPLNYRVSFGKKKSRGFFETGISIGMVHTQFELESSEIIWHQGVPSGSQKHFSKSKFTNFDGGINNALGYKYSITSTLDFVSALSFNYHTATPYDYFVGGGWSGSLLIGCQIGVSYTFKVYNHQKRTKPR